jgi:hypothetical protein
MMDRSDRARPVGKPRRDAQDSKVAVTVIRTLLRRELEIGQARAAWSAAS